MVWRLALPPAFLHFNPNSFAMKISIISVFPEFHQSINALSIIGKAVQQGLVSFDFIRFSDLCEPKERIDEPTCGPGAGMILKPVVVQKAIELAEQRWGQGFKVFFSPHGTVLTQPILRQYAAQFFAQSNQPALSGYPVEALAKTDVSKGMSVNHLILVCGRYEGIDERVERHYADALISIGDYVLMGGDLPAQVFLEGLLRLLPGVIGNQESVEQESFESAFLDHPHYGLPAEWNGMKIPDVLRSGNHAAIDAWRKDAAAKRTVHNRFDWFVRAQPNPPSIALAKKFIPVHYVAVMHTQVIIKGGTVGQTSIPSIDIHDIARACASYGIKNFFIVSPLLDQQKIVATFMEFWLSADGAKYNENRHQAISSIRPVLSYQEMIDLIVREEGQEPLIVCTSARNVEHKQHIDYFSQKIVWSQEKPVLFLFGTGQGLSDELVQKSDFVLAPIEGLTDYNHLSVRSAVSIILDRWLGLSPRFCSSKKDPVS